MEKEDEEREGGVQLFAPHPHYIFLALPLSFLFLQQQNLFRCVSENSLLLCAVVTLHLSEMSTGAVLVKEVECLILDGSWGHAQISKSEFSAIVNENIVLDHSIQDVCIHDRCGSSKLPGEEWSVDHEGWAGNQIGNELYNFTIRIHIRTGELKRAATELMAILERRGRMRVDRWKGKRPHTIIIK